MRWKLLFLVQLGICLAGATAFGEVVRFELLEVESPTFDGRRFGEVGQYEKLIGLMTLAVDPDDPHNASVVDLELAPRNADGRVEFVAEVAILKPVDLRQGNRRIFYEVVNRGRKIGLGLMNDAPRLNGPTAAADAGNGFLMRQGYTVVWSGWQGDMEPGEGRMGLTVPTLTAVSGVNREEFIFDHEIDPVVATLSYPTADLDPAKATLTVRPRQHDARVTPADLSFDYLMVLRAGMWFRSPHQILIERPAGFDAGAIYEFIHAAKNPLVMGLAFASVRDVTSFLRHRSEDTVGNPNPLSAGGVPLIDRVYALGISQSGRFLRDMLYQGFNEDEAGLVVFDGLIPDVAGARRTWVNRRFAQPGRFSLEHEAHLQPGDQFPFAYNILTDAITGQRDGILARCQAAANCPKIMHVDTATEFFQARASLIVTDTNGQPIELPSNVRAYLISSAPHSNPIDAVVGPTAHCQQSSNPLHAGGPMRALLVALDDWVSRGTQPPASRFPSRREGTLVTPNRESVGFPEIPGVAYDGRINELHLVNYGVQPPTEGAQYPVFVPRVDSDGNDGAGIRMPEVEVPVATYLGWNLRRKGHAEGSLCGVTGSTIPFAGTEAERIEVGDPRRSLQERYASREDYARQVADAARRLVEQRLLLQEDAERMISRARARAQATGAAHR